MRNEKCSKRGGTHVGTRKAIPVSLPLRAGMTLPTALAAPVAEGMMLAEAPRPPRQSLAEGPSTVFWVAVVAWTLSEREGTISSRPSGGGKMQTHVVMRASTMVNLSLRTLARGARQLVVHEALPGRRRAE